MSQIETSRNDLKFEHQHPIVYNICMGCVEWLTWRSVIFLGYCILLIALFTPNLTFADMAAVPSTPKEAMYDMDTDFIGKMYLLNEQHRFNFANYIPLNNLPQNDNGSVIAKRIFRFTAQNYLDEAKDQNSPAIKSAAKANNNMKKSVGGENHSVLMRFRPVSATAEMRYRGTWPIEGVLAYEVDTEIFSAEISRKLNGKQYYVTHIEDSQEKSDLVGVRWQF